MSQSTPKTLLLSCCAPCSCGVIRMLAQEKRNFAALFFNPNIRPESEYIKRRDENARVCKLYNIPFIELPYAPHLWEETTKGLTDEPERGLRCDKCFELRLLTAAKYAKENGYETFTSVLGMSRHKDLDQVNRAAATAAAAQGIPYDFNNWRLTPGGQLRTALAAELSLYRQNYCGCKPRM